MTVQEEAGPDVEGVCDWWFYKIRAECLRDSSTDTTFQKVQETLAESLHSQDEKGYREVVWFLLQSA
jgi:hypothetical protein